MPLVELVVMAVMDSMVLVEQLRSVELGVVGDMVEELLFFKYQTQLDQN
jgi:hypothetical protein